jgi:pentatricopeptide repeat protein
VRAAKAVPPGTVFVYTRLIDAYTKGKDMAASREVFVRMPCPGVGSRNALLVGHARNKMYLKALSVFREVAEQGGRCF